MKRYRARWIFPGETLPLKDATIGIDGDRIVELGTGDSDAEDLGEVAILPGLMNAHTHLEFSSITKPLEPLENFPEWIRSVIQYRRIHNEEPGTCLQSGLSESQSAGTTSLAEIATVDWRETLTSEQVSHLPSSVVMFREYLGLAEEAVERGLNDAKAFLNNPNLTQVTPALSPHAPYSVHPELFAGLCQLAEQNRTPLAMHLAESPAELQLLQTGKGPLAELFTEMQVFRPELFARPRSILNFLERLDCGVPALVVHGNLLTDQEIEFLSTRPQMSVVYCPRTHSAMQSSQHPWQRLLAAGVNVAIGTDSRASNPDLSIWRELVFLRKKFPKVAPGDLLKLATVNAAQALGLKDRGSIKVGNLADLCLFNLPEGIEGDPLQRLLVHVPSPTNVMVAGNWA